MHVSVRARQNRPGQLPHWAFVIHHPDGPPFISRYRFNSAAAAHAAGRARIRHRQHRRVAA